MEEKETKPEYPTLPMFPDDDLTTHWFIGADEAIFTYQKFDSDDDRPWFDPNGNWFNPDDLIARHHGALPLTEVTADMILDPTQDRSER